MSADVRVGPDTVARCAWVGDDAEYRRYHDEEWGVPLHGDRPLFEKMSLEGFQAGLSWITILRKRPRFREVFAGFDPAAVAEFDESDVERLMQDAGIIRNRAKIVATISNARLLREMEPGEFDAFMWSFAPDDLAASGVVRRRRGRHARVGRDEQGAAKARVPLRRPDHDVCADAVLRAWSTTTSRDAGALRIADREPCAWRAQLSPEANARRRGVLRGRGSAVRIRSRPGNLRFPRRTCRGAWWGIPQRRPSRNPRAADPR